MSDKANEAYPERSSTSDQPISADQARDNSLAIWRTFWPERNELRAYVSNWCARSDVNKQTINSYWKRVELAERAESGLDQARTASTWRSTKYAQVHVFSALIMQSLRSADKADREKRYGDAVRLIKEAMRDRARLDRIRKARLPPGLKPARSKRKIVAKMPENFTDLFFKAATDPVLKDALAALAVGGWRPGELDSGHGVTVFRDGQNLVLRGIGEKVKGEAQGMEWRQITVEPRSACALHLFKKCEAASFTITVKSSQWLTDRTRTLGRQITGRNDVTPYVWRHRMAMQAKQECGEDKVSIAIVLGQSSVKTQVRYGYRGGKSMAFPDKIVAVEGAKSRAEIQTQAPRRTYG